MPDDESAESTAESTHPADHPASHPATNLPLTATNAFGEEVTVDGTDVWEVPPDQYEADGGLGSDASFGGDDMGDWTPEAHYEKHPEHRPEEPVEADDDTPMPTEALNDRDQAREGELLPPPPDDEPVDIVLVDGGEEE